jgi:hypothetical protein
MGPDGPGLSCPGSSVVADSESAGVKFEKSTAPETIGHYCAPSSCSQSLTVDSEEGKDPVKPDGTR